MSEIEMRRVAVMVARVVIADCANIDVEKTVPIDIGHGDAGGPIGIAGYSGPGRDIFKNEIAFIKIEFVAALVGRQIDIGQTVIIDVPNRHTRSIVVIQVVEYAQRIPVDILVDKRYAGFSGFQSGEKHRLAMCTALQEGCTKKECNNNMIAVQQCVSSRDFVADADWY